MSAGTHTGWSRSAKDITTAAHNQGRKKGHVIVLLPPEIDALLPPLETLTPHQRSLLRGLCMGLSNAELAAQLSISDQAVKNTLTKIYRRLGLPHDVASCRRARLAYLYGHWEASQKGGDASA